MVVATVTQAKVDTTEDEDKRVADMCMRGSAKRFWGGSIYALGGSARPVATRPYPY